MKEKILLVVVGVLLILNISNYFEIKKLNNKSGSQENRFKNEETYSFGGITLLKANNLPLTGYCLIFDKKDGFLNYESYYINGRKNGYSKVYFKDGSLESSENYDDGLLDGASERWYENGRKQSDTRYNNGEIDGVSLWWYENGQIKSISHWVNGLRIGWQREYLENGNLLYEVNLIKGNGIISFKDDKTGMQITKNYIDGKEVNPLKGKGNTKIGNIFIHETSFENGEINGLQRRIYLKKINRKPTEFNYKHGLHNGFEKYWHDNGKLSSEGEYFFEQKNGLWQEWYENGKPKELANYEYGILVSKKCWDESGKIIDCECYNNNNEKIKCP